MGTWSVVPVMALSAYKFFNDNMLTTNFTRNGALSVYNFFKYTYFDNKDSKHTQSQGMLTIFFTRNGHNKDSKYTHTHTHTPPHTSLGNGTEEKGFKKRKVFKEDSKN